LFGDGLSEPVVVHLQCSVVLLQGDHLDFEIVHVCLLAVASVLSGSTVLHLAAKQLLFSCEVVETLSLATRLPAVRLLKAGRPDGGVQHVHVAVTAVVEHVVDGTVRGQEGLR